MPTNEHAGDRMRSRRIELGLSQQDVAEALGTKQEAISLWEKRGPRNLATVKRIAHALDCDPGWLAFGSRTEALGSLEGEL